MEYNILSQTPESHFAEVQMPIGEAERSPLKLDPSVSWAVHTESYLYSSEFKITDNMHKKLAGISFLKTFLVRILTVISDL